MDKLLPIIKVAYGIMLVVSWILSILFAWQMRRHLDPRLSEDEASLVRRTLIIKSRYLTVIGQKKRMLALLFIAVWVALVAVGGWMSALAK